jgi:hypothetical protein
VHARTHAFLLRRVRASASGGGHCCNCKAPPGKQPPRTWTDGSNEILVVVVAPLTTCPVPRRTLFFLARGEAGRGAGSRAAVNHTRTLWGRGCLVGWLAVPAHQCHFPCANCSATPALPSFIYPKHTKRTDKDPCPQLKRVPALLCSTCPAPAPAPRNPRLLASPPRQAARR